MATLLSASKWIYVLQGWPSGWKGSADERLHLLLAGAEWEDQQCHDGGGAGALEVLRHTALTVLYEILSI